MLSVLAQETPRTANIGVITTPLKELSKLPLDPLVSLPMLHQCGLQHAERILLWGCLFCWRQKGLAVLSELSERDPQ